MAKPFKLTGEEAATTLPSPAGIGRMPDGKFTRIESPEPSELANEAREAGTYVSQAVQERRVPDRLVGTPVPTPPALDPDKPPAPVIYKDAIPWSDASGPSNETKTSPMRGMKSGR